MNNEFWTDALVKEFAEQNRGLGLMYKVKSIEEFKASKEQLNMNNESVTRPPLGIEPEYIWVEGRLARLESAIERYLYQGKQVPEQWYEEQVKHVKWLDSYRQKKEQLKPKEWEIVNSYAGEGKDTIVSVRRLSDNEVFSVSDTIQTDNGKIDNITSFQITDGGAMFVDFHTGCRLLSKIKHEPPKKQPLFTTEDGKEIFEGDKYWCVGNFIYWFAGAASKIAKSGTTEGRHYFSTEEAAKEYVLLDKPMLSVNDVVEELKDFGGNNFLHGDASYLIHRLKQKIKH